MPQPIEHRLILLLLPWIVILTIGQVAFFTFYMFHSRGDAAPEPTQPTADSNTSHIIKGKMLSFHAASGEPTQNIMWEAMKKDADLASTVDEKLIIHQNGYYFLCLQVKLQQDDQDRKHTVSLKIGHRPVLEGNIIHSSSSTVFMCKVEELSVGDTLVATIKPEAKINNNHSHMDLIYLSKP